MKTCRSILSAVFVFLLCFAGAAALHAETYGDFDYSTANGAATITAYNGAGGAVAIPSPINGYAVTNIGDRAFYHCSGLTSVTIPSSVTSIGGLAFNSCSGLTSVTIPNSVTSIGSGAFSYCSGLTSVTIPGSVTSIGDDAFRGCSGLTSVTIPTSVTSIGDRAFYECSGLTSVTIPDSVTSIGHEAFWGCSGLTSVTIPDSVTSIGESAFYNCSGLTSVMIPNSVTSIGSYAFCCCDGLTSVMIPNSVTRIGEWAFSGCYGLTSVTIPNSVTSIGSGAFSYCSGLTSVTIPASVTSIGGGAFSGCSGLTSVTIPNNVTRIGNFAFGECTGLTSVMISKSMISMGDYAFYGCTGLTSVTIPNSVTSIGDYAFQWCASLKSVTIPNSVIRIGERAFEGCVGLKSVTIPDSVTSIGWGAFYGCSGLTSVTIPASVTSIGESAFGGCSGLTSVTMPSGFDVTRISGDAFTKCRKLTLGPWSSWVGAQIQLDFSKYGISEGTMNLVGALPTGLWFNAETGMIEGEITGKVGRYPLTLQFLTGTTVTRSISLPLVITARPSGVVGTFQGLLVPYYSGPPVGKISLVTTAAGVWTASLDRAGSAKVLTAKGGFSFDPVQGTVDLTIPFSPALTVQVRLDPNSTDISGDYPANSPEGSIEGFRMASGSELPTGNQSFTLTLDQGAQDGIATPAGMGWATGTVSNKGAIALNGQLGDGKAFKIATRLSATGEAVVWLKPYSNLNSFVGGIISLRERGLVNDSGKYTMRGSLRWYRVADPKEPSYPNGFGPLWVDAGIAPYKVPANAAVLAQSLGLETTTFPSLIIDGGGLPDDILASLPTSLTLDSAFKLNAVKNVGQTLLPWTGVATKANGRFSGTLTLPASTSDVLAGPATVSGVLLEGSYYFPHVGSGLIKIPLKSPKGSFRTAAIVTSGEAP